LAGIYELRPLYSSKDNSPRPKEEGSLKRAGAKDSEHLIIIIFDF